jgi:hypothetical protein
MITLDEKDIPRYHPIETPDMGWCVVEQGTSAVLARLLTEEQARILSFGSTMLPIMKMMMKPSSPAGRDFETILARSGMKFT